MEALILFFILLVMYKFVRWLFSTNIDTDNLMVGDPATPRQREFIRRLARKAGWGDEDVSKLSKLEASERIDKLLEETDKISNDSVFFYYYDDDDDDDD